MSGTPPSPNDKNSTDNIQTNISSVKERIISSSKLFKVLTRSKKDIESKTDENSELQAKITILERDVISKDLRLSLLEKNNFELQTKLLSLQEKKDDALENTSVSNSQDIETISMLRDKIQSLETKNSNTEKALTSNKMYIQQLEAECESLKQEKAEVGSSKLRQDITKKTQEVKTLNSQVKDLKKQVEELNTKVEEVETENERLDIENMALKMDAEEKESESNPPVKVEELQAALNNAKEDISSLESKLETETRRYTNANTSYTEELKVTTSLKSKVQSLKEEKVELNDKIRELQEERYELKTRLEKAKSTTKTSSSTEQSSGMSPSFISKLKKFKANYNLLKIENKFLKQQLQKKDMKLSKQQNLEELLQSSSDDDSEDMDVDVIPTSARRMVSESVTPPPPVKPSKAKSLFRAPSPTSESSRDGLLVSPTRKISFADQIPTPMHRRTSSSSSSKSSTASATKSGLKQKSAPIEIIAIDLDQSSPDDEPVASIAPDERISAPLAIAVSSSRKEKSITANKPESLDRLSSSSKLKAAFRTAGLEVPAPKFTAPVSTTTAKPKKATNKLQKFVNSRNPSKVIDSRPLISRSTASSKRALSPEKPSSVVRRESSTATVMNDISTPDVLPVEEHIIKKTKLDTTYADRIKNWIQNKHLFTEEEFSKDDIRKCLTEIIENYSSMKSPSDPDSKENIPFGIEGKFTIELPNKVDSREKAYAWALSVLAKQNANYFQVIYKTLNRGLKAALTSKRPDTSCARYARLLCTICKSAGSLEVIRVVCYDIIRRSTCNKNSIICLYNIASGWKEALVMTNNKCMMLSSLQVCCNVIATDKRTPSNVKQMYEKMKKLCSWPVSIDMGSLDDEVQAVYNEFLTLEKITDSVAFKRKCFQVLKSFELIFYFMNCWKKLYNNFILEKMWPLLSNDKLSEVALEIMATLGTFGLSIDHAKHDKPGVQQLFELMMQVITVDNALSGIQMTALKGAYKLSVYDAGRITEVKNSAKTILS